MRKTLENLLNRVAKEMDCPQMDEVAAFLLANGVIVPPCKVGDTVYYLPHTAIFEATVISIEVNYYTNPQLWLTIEYCLFSKHHYKTRIDLMLGKTVFLTKEEAEKALAERSGER